MITCALAEIFDIKYGVNLELNALEVCKDGINFVARTSRNNGVTARVRKIPYVTPIPAGTISVACGGSVMESFLQSSPYYSGRDLFFLTPKTEMSDEVKLFYCHCIRMNKFKYSYGRQANVTLPSLEVPVLSAAEDFVNDFSITKLQSSMIENLDLSWLNIEVSNKGEKRGLVPLSELFHTKNGVASSGIKRLHYKKNDNWIPYIRPSYKQLTSIDAYVNKNMFTQDEIFPKGTLYVSTDGQGSHTYSYVSVCEFVPNSNVTVLIPKEPMTLKEKLFYSMCITHNRFKFSYGRKPKGFRLENVLLPDKMGKMFDKPDLLNW